MEASVLLKGGGGAFFTGKKKQTQSLSLYLHYLMFALPASSILRNRYASSSPAYPQNCCRPNLSYMFASLPSPVSSTVYFPFLPICLFLAKHSE